MTQTVTVPGVGDLEFPDGMSQQDMANAIKHNFPDIHKEQKASQPKEPPTLMGEISSGFRREAQHGGLIGGAVGAAAGAASYGVNRLSEATGRAVQSGAEALGATPGGMVSKGSEIAGEMIPSMALGGGIGKSVASPIARSSAEHLMTSALKPTLEAARTGKAARAIQTMLDEGISVTKGGMQKLRGKIDELNQEIKQRIAQSTATVNKRQVVRYLDDLTNRLKTQVNPQSDLASIRKSFEDFMRHPQLRGKSDIPVQQAQELKQGTYRALSEKAFGEEKSTSIEAQKALARGLKEGIAQKVPEIAGLNQKESALLNALNVTERRMLVELNKNPAGLSLLSKNPASAIAFMADRSAAFKSLLARLINRQGGNLGGAVGAGAGGGLYESQKPLSATPDR
jgi:hypothetical protein